MARIHTCVNRVLNIAEFFLLTPHIYKSPFFPLLSAVPLSIRKNTHKLPPITIYDRFVISLFFLKRVFPYIQFFNLFDIHSKGKNRILRFTGSTSAQTGVFIFKSEISEIRC